MDDLITWLRAQLDEDERVAHEATSGPWSAKPVVYGPPEEGWGEPESYEIQGGDGQRKTVVWHVNHEGGGTDRLNAAHIARWNPARVLAEVEVKRRILDAGMPSSEHEHVGEYLRFGGWVSCTDDCPGVVWLEVVKLLAQPYAGQPGWREEWRV